MKQHNLQEIFPKHFIGWSLMHNYSYASNGRIWVIWKGSIQVQLIGISNQSVTCRIQYNTQIFYFSVIYDCNQ